MSTDSPAIVVVGSLNADLIVRTKLFPRAGETVHGSDILEAPGGKSANQAVAAARLGVDTALIGAVGADHYGRLLLESLVKAGVDVSQVYQEPESRTGTAIVTIDEMGENTIIVSPGANARLSPEAVERSLALFRGADYLCLCLESPLLTVTRAAEHGHENGVQVVLNLSPFADVPRELLGLVDILIVNEHEAAQLFSLHGSDGLRDWNAAHDRLDALSIGMAVITRGEYGAVVVDTAADIDGRVQTVNSPHVVPVDTTGAGDAFTGALTARLCAGYPIVEAAEFAARVGAFATQTVGAQTGYPSLREIESWKAL